MSQHAYGIATVGFRCAFFPLVILWSEDKRHLSHSTDVQKGGSKSSSEKALAYSTCRKEVSVPGSAELNNLHRHEQAPFLKKKIEDTVKCSGPINHEIPTCKQ